MKKAALILGLILIVANICFAMGETPIAKEKGKASMSTNNKKAILETSMGKITIELYPDKAPATVKNFLNYIDSGHYDGTIFHRVINGFMIQGGGFKKGMEQKPTQSPIKNEANNGLLNKRGTIAMARTNVIDSATSQFFINVAGNDFLNYKDDSEKGFGYCVFGQVIDGMEVVDKIKSAATHTVGHYQNVPAEDITIITAKRVAN